MPSQGSAVTILLPLRIVATEADAEFRPITRCADVTIRRDYLLTLARIFDRVRRYRRAASG